ncbi:MAG TPA: FAD-dependent oxidoreductase [Chloroflexota bacterium]|nr:FAD-dependent oxidoreductase [Chloroflexota bacterium]
MNPLWVDVAAQTFPALQQTIEVDVAVIGGGFSGLGAAHRLGQAGANTALVEARTIASGASGRNAGFLVSGAALGFRATVRSLGDAPAREIRCLTERNQQTILGLIEQHDIDCGFLRRGSMSLAADDAEWEDLLLDLEAMTAAGVNACRVDRGDLPRPFGRLYLGGVYVPGNAEINPGSFLRSVAMNLPGAVRVFEMTRVEAVHHSGRWHVRAGRGEIRARAVILAANAYTQTVWPAAPIVPTRGQVLATDPLPRVVVPFPMGANRGFQYWRQTAEGRLVIGGWRDLAPDEEVGTVEALNHDIQRALDAFRAQLTSQAAATRWAGIMGFTSDHFPLVGAVPGSPDLYVAAGYSGHGVSMAFTCGALVAARAIGEQSRIPLAFDPGRLLA